MFAVVSSHRANDADSNPADAKSSPRILGGVGRMGARWHGFLHLRARSGSGAARLAASIGNSRATTANIGYYGGILFALFLVGWGMALLVGAGRRPVWARPHLDAHHYLFFTFYFAERIFHEHLDARRASASGRNRHRRRMGDRRDADLGRVAGRAANHGRGHDAHGLLLRIFSGRPGQLFCRQPVRLEMDVRGRRRAGAARDPDSQRNERAGALGSQARSAWREIER